MLPLLIQFYFKSQILGWFRGSSSVWWKCSWDNFIWNQLWNISWSLYKSLRLYWMDPSDNVEKMKFQKKKNFYLGENISKFYYKIVTKDNKNSINVTWDNQNIYFYCINIKTLSAKNSQEMFLWYISIN